MIKSIVTNIKELHKPCELVTQGEDIKSIIQDLKDTLEFKKCIGLTANQIGINKKISYIKIPTFVDKEKQVKYNEYVLINVKILEKEKPIQVKREACVSFPGLEITTKRYVYITAEYLNEEMRLITGVFQDLDAICIQHEYSHQQGRTILDDKWRTK